MDFAIPDELSALKERTDTFVRDEMIPRENDSRLGHHGPSEEFRRELVALGRRAGLLSPHIGAEWGGLGLDHRGKAVMFEAAGYSPLGPIALHCFAPDEGNAHLLEQVATEAQKEEYHRPLASGDIRSCFMMTEPAPGAGSVIIKQERMSPAASGRRYRSFWPSSATCSRRCMLASSGAKQLSAIGPNGE